MATTGGRWEQQADGTYVRETRTGDGRWLTREWVNRMPECDCDDPSCDAEHPAFEAQLRASLVLAKGGIRRFGKLAR